MFKETLIKCTCSLCGATMWNAAKEPKNEWEASAVSTVHWDGQQTAAAYISPILFIPMNNWTIVINTVLGSKLHNDRIERKISSLKNPPPPLLPIPSPLPTPPQCCTSKYIWIWTENWNVLKGEHCPHWEFTVDCTSAWLYDFCDCTTRHEMGTWSAVAPVLNGCQRYPNKRHRWCTSDHRTEHTCPINTTHLPSNHIHSNKLYTTNNIFAYTPLYANLLSNLYACSVRKYLQWNTIFLKALQTMQLLTIISRR